MNSGNYCFTKVRNRPTISWLIGFGLMLLAAVGFMILPEKTIAQNAEFVMQPAGGNYCAPAQIKFKPSFSETPLAYYWQTGMKDEESQELSPDITYAVPGTYRVTLVVLFSNKLLEVTHPITIYGNPVIAIKPDRNAICKPGNVTFSLSSGSKIKIATWDFGDSTISTNPNGGQPVTHPYNDYGSFPVNVTGVDIWGCTGSGSFVMEVKPLTAELIDSPLNGCLPADVLLKARITVPEGSTVTNYLWDFKDGSPKINSNANEILHAYSIADTLMPSVTVTTSDGCTNSFLFNPISIGKQPVAPLLSVNKPTGCASEKMYFTASGAKGNKYYWMFDDGSLFSSGLELTTTDSVLEYEFEALGDFSIRVIAENNGCKSEVSDLVSVSIIGVVADFAYSNSCMQKNRFTFRNTSEGTINKIRWTFIDSSNKSSQPRPSFTFPQQGNFVVTMIVTENASGCSDTASTTIYTALPKLLPSDTFICIGNNLNLDISDSYNSARTTYTWTVAGKNYPSGSNKSFSGAPTLRGVFSNRVIIFNGQGYCRDTLVQEKLVKVSGPNANFTSHGPVCLMDNVLAIDSSVPGFESSPIVAWKWDFGNGVFSNDPEPKPVKYNAPGNYSILLEVEDVDGCTGTASNKIRVNRLPLLRLVPRNQKVCQGQDISLKALHKGSLLWSTKGITGCDTCSNITLRPMTPTKILASATDGHGCTSEDSINIDVWFPFELSNGVLRDTGICIGNRVPLDLKITGKLINWFPSKGLSSSVISNPVAKPDTTTTYTAVITDSGRCFSRTARAVIEVNPIPVVDPGPDLVLPYNAPFTLKPTYSKGIASYNWQPAGLLNCSDCPEPTGKATLSTLFTVNVVSDKGCKSSASIGLTLDCSEKNLLMPTAFSPNSDGLNDYFYPLTRGISIIRRFVIYNRLGELVYENINFKPNDRNFGWNGMFRGKVQPAGSFVYFVEAECDLGNTLSTKGNILLMR